MPPKTMLSGRQSQKSGKELPRLPLPCRCRLAGAQFDLGCQNPRQFESHIFCMPSHCLCYIKYSLCSQQKTTEVKGKTDEKQYSKKYDDKIEDKTKAVIEKYPSYDDQTDKREGNKDEKVLTSHKKEVIEKDGITNSDKEVKKYNNKTDKDDHDKYKEDEAIKESPGKHITDSIENVTNAIDVAENETNAIDVAKFKEEVGTDYMSSDEEYSDELDDESDSYEDSSATKESQVESRDVKISPLKFAIHSERLENNAENGADYADSNEDSNTENGDDYANSIESNAEHEEEEVNENGDDYANSIESNAEREEEEAHDKIKKVPKTKDLALSEAGYSRKTFYQAHIFPKHMLAELKVET